MAYNRSIAFSNRCMYIMYKNKERKNAHIKWKHINKHLLSEKYSLPWICYGYGKSKALHCADIHKQSVHWMLSICIFYQIVNSTVKMFKCHSNMALPEHISEMLWSLRCNHFWLRQEMKWKKEKKCVFICLCRIFFNSLVCGWLYFLSCTSNSED